MPELRFATSGVLQLLQPRLCCSRESRKFADAQVYLSIRQSCCSPAVGLLSGLGSRRFSRSGMPADLHCNGPAALHGPASGLLLRSLLLPCCASVQVPDLGPPVRAATGEVPEWDRRGTALAHHAQAGQGQHCGRGG